MLILEVESVHVHDDRCPIDRWPYFYLSVEPYAVAVGVS